MLFNRKLHAQQQDKPVNITATRTTFIGQDGCVVSAKLHYVFLKRKIVSVIITNKQLLLQLIFTKFELIKN